MNSDSSTRCSDLEAERIIVGTIALFPTGFSEATEALDPSDFTDPLCRAVFSIGKSVRERWGDVPDIETVIEKLDDLGVLYQLGGADAVYGVLGDFGSNILVYRAIEVVKQAAAARRIAEAVREPGRGRPSSSSGPAPRRQRRKTPRDSFMPI